jgi:hypothetical protein
MIKKGDKVRILLPNRHRMPQGGRVGQVVGRTKGDSVLVDFVYHFHKFHNAYSEKDLVVISEDEYQTSVQHEMETS